MTTEPVQIAVAAVANQAEAIVSVLQSELGGMIRSLEEYGCVRQGPIPSVPLLIRAANSLPHALTERIGERCQPDWFGIRAEVQIPMFLEALTGIVSVGLIPGGKSGARNTRGPG